MNTRPVTTGADRVVADPSLLGSAPIGLLTNFTGTTADLGRNVDALVRAGVPVVGLFAPEHGLAGSVQAGESEPGGRDEATGVTVHDTYLAPPAALDTMIEDSGAEVLAFDMQDLGLRFYTYIWTMYDCLLAAARTGRRFVVLDRPNPLGGVVTSGPTLEPGFESFVGRTPLPLRHGLTAGELATWLNATVVPAETGRSVDLTVITATGWKRSDFFDDTGLPWVPPSVNMPTLDTAFAYCGTGLFEGTNVSEGRGTTRPFEVIGAPYVDGRWAAALRSAGLPGVAFRDVTFIPTFHKYVGERCRGVHLHVQDRHLFHPIRTALTMMETLRDLCPEFGVLAAGERTDGDGASWALDRLWGSDSLRTAIAAGGSLADLVPEDRAVADAYPGLELRYP